MLFYLCYGEMTEWPNVPDSKSGVGATPPRVRIPLSPPFPPKIAIFYLTQSEEDYGVQPWVAVLEGNFLKKVSLNPSKTFTHFCNDVAK